MYLFHPTAVPLSPAPTPPANTKERAPSWVAGEGGRRKVAVQGGGCADHISTLCAQPGSLLGADASCKENCCLSFSPAHLYFQQEALPAGLYL